LGDLYKGHNKQLLPTLSRLSGVEAPQSTRGRMPAQHPAAFIYSGEFARMNAAFALICRDIFLELP